MFVKYNIYNIYTDVFWTADWFKILNDKKKQQGDRYPSIRQISGCLCNVASWGKGVVCISDKVPTPGQFAVVVK